METQITNKWFKVTTGAYVCLLVVSFFILSAPPGKFGIYITMGALAVGACFLGKSFLRMLAVLLLVLAFILAAVEYKRGQDLHEKVHEIKNPID